MVNIKSELSTNQIVLLLMPSAEYNEIMVETLKQLSDKSIAYVTLNKTVDALKEIFEKNEVDIKNVIFIDAISKTIKKAPSQSDQVFYCSSPGALTEISLVISKFLKHNFDYLIFDSLTNLSIYQKKAPVTKFVSSLINKIKTGKTKAIFYALEGDDELVKKSSLFVDKVIKTDGEK